MATTQSITDEMHVTECPNVARFAVQDGQTRFMVCDLHISTAVNALLPSTRELAQVRRLVSDEQDCDPCCPQSLLRS